MQNVRRVVAILLTSLLPCACSPGFGATSFSSRSGRQTAGHGKDERARALYVLNRLAFGPRPGEVDEVAALGVDRWIDWQLHPESIDDSALGLRLADYTAPFMTPQSLMMKFPPRNLIRQAMQGRIAVPADPQTKAVWESEIARMQQRQKLQDRDPAQAAQPKISMSEDTAPGQPGTMRGTQDAEMSELPDGSPGPRADLTGADLVTLPAQSRYEKLLSVEPGGLRELVRELPPAQRPALIAGMTPSQRETVIALLSPRLVVVNETEDVRLLQDIYSQRQLQRVMIEFWLNHFNVFAGKNEIEPYYLPQLEQAVVAPRALGKFEDLLDAVAESPAMLLYLDNQKSVGPNSLFALRRDRSPQPPAVQAAMLPQPPDDSHPGINENYGRELMELHTVGVNGGYTQQDVIEAAKVLSGWTVAPPQQGGGFRFQQNRHEPGGKTVMGRTIAASGEQERLQLLHILATSPSTAHFISRELAVRFVSDTPSPALVDRMAGSFLTNDGDIAKVLETMIHSPEFWSASGNGHKLKTPLDDVISAVRATDAEVSQPYRLASELITLGMPLTGTQQPNGYPMTNDAWTGASELVNRMNFALALATNRIPGVTVSIDSLLGPNSSGWTPARQEAALEETILHGPASPQVRRAMLAGLDGLAEDSQAPADMVPDRDGKGGADRAWNPFVASPRRPEFSPENTREAVMAGLLIGSPEFQWR